MKHKERNRFEDCGSKELFTKVSVHESIIEAVGLSSSREDILYQNNHTRIKLEHQSCKHSIPQQPQISYKVISD